MADDAVERRFGGHGDHRLHCAGIDFLPGDNPVVEAGHDVAGAGGGFGLTLDLELVAARGDIDTQAVFDGDQILVILPEQRAQQMRFIESDFQTGALGDVGARTVMWLFRHRSTSPLHGHTRKDGHPSSKPSV